MPAADRSRIRPVASVSVKVIADILRHAGLHLDCPFKRGMFHHIDSLPLVSSDDLRESVKEDEKVKRWLSEKHIPFAAPIYLHYDDSNILLTDWEMLIRYWRLFYYPVSDDLTVFDESLAWSLLFFHEHEIFFGANCNA